MTAPHVSFVASSRDGKPWHVHTDDVVVRLSEEDAFRLGVKLLARIFDERERRGDSNVHRLPVGDGSTR